MHPVSHDEWHENTIKLPSGGRGLSEDQYKLTQGGPVDLIAPTNIADNSLTRDENAVMFAVAVRAYNSCQMWALELIEENYSHFQVKDMVEDLGWDRKKVEDIVSSLKSKGVVRRVDPALDGYPLNTYYIDISENTLDVCYDTMKSFMALDPETPNPFIVGSGASDPCPANPDYYVTEAPKGKQQIRKDGSIIARQVWRVLFSGQSWVWDHAPFANCETPVGVNAEWCKGDANIIYNGGFVCEKHYTEGREFEQDQQAYFDEMVRPELQWMKADRIETQNILESLGPGEGGPVDGKDWIQELNEKGV
ncbi:MAG: hypothetical protein QGH27_09180, partial [SAR324 cluster bacterium]|jgi:hypothetical protein|nr:hypothetical protein [SAR324 cluster bacterium]